MRLILNVLDTAVASKYSYLSKNSVINPDLSASHLDHKPARIGTYKKIQIESTFSDISFRHQKSIRLYSGFFLKKCVTSFILKFKNPDHIEFDDPDPLLKIIYDSVLPGWGGL